MKSWVRNVHKSKNPIAAEKLAASMSEISEDYEAAGWLMGLEFQLWRMLHGGSSNMAFGDVEEDRLAELRELSAEAGGWVYWRDNSDPFKSGECFVPMAEWADMYRAHSSANHSSVTVDEKGSKTP